MTTKRRILSGGIGMALVAALGAAAPQMWDSWLDYRKSMYALELSAEHHRSVDLCREAGGKWWKGDCLEVR